MVKTKELIGECGRLFLKKAFHFYKKLLNQTFLYCLRS
ncbi:hypothetical protein BN8_02322 [Fibrisoma limi BUZ 3]|uniref:Uncharacterized protein n=1 Tax=Fibrisoma limi BUZ 3 TaxID=1185876 RepID=I2GH68_9BACT|nr:hypothetical protein BN8_02322 [Fibrisoma limi BUZ 3]